MWVHDHRTQKVKDTPITGKVSIIHLKKTRYNCTNCGKRFEGNQSLVTKHYTVTLRLILNILNEFKEVCSIKSIAKRLQIILAHNNENSKNATGKQKHPTQSNVYG